MLTPTLCILFVLNFPLPSYESLQPFEIIFLVFWLVSLPYLLFLCHFILPLFLFCWFPIVFNFSSNFYNPVRNVSWKVHYTGITIFTAKLSRNWKVISPIRQDFLHALCCAAESPGTKAKCRLYRSQISHEKKVMEQHEFLMFVTLNEPCTHAVKIYSPIQRSPTKPGFLNLHLESKSQQQLDQGAMRPWHQGLPNILS